MSRATKIIEKYNAETKCTKVKTIQDINKQHNYSDEFPDGERDDDYVACGQEGNYNELQNIYDTKLKKYVDVKKEKKFPEKEAIKALCETCAELKSPRTRDDFYRMLGKKLNISIQK